MLYIEYLAPGRPKSAQRVSAVSAARYRSPAFGDRCYLTQSLGDRSL